MCFALCAKRSVLVVSFRLRAAGEIVAMMKVRDRPPSESCTRHSSELLMVPGETRKPSLLDACHAQASILFYIRYYLLINLLGTACSWWRRRAWSRYVSLLSRYGTCRLLKPRCDSTSAEITRPSCVRLLLMPDASCSRSPTAPDAFCRSFPKLIILDHYIINAGPHLSELNI